MPHIGGADVFRLDNVPTKTGETINIHVGIYVLLICISRRQKAIELLAFQKCNASISRESASTQRPSMRTRQPQLGLTTTSRKLLASDSVITEKANSFQARFIEEKSREQALGRD